MEIKSFITGILATLMILLTIGTALAALAPGGTTIEVPNGKWGIYFFIDNTDNQRIINAVRWTKMNESIGINEAASILNTHTKKCVQHYVLSAEKEAALAAFYAQQQNNTLNTE